MGMAVVSRQDVFVMVTKVKLSITSLKFQMKYCIHFVFNIKGKTKSKNQTFRKFCPDSKLVLSEARVLMVLGPGAILPTFDKISKAAGFKFQTSFKNLLNIF